MIISHVNATTIGDAWFQCVYETLHKGRIVPIDKGSFEKEQYRLETDFITISIRKPWDQPMLPVFPEMSNLPNPYSEESAKQYFLNYICSSEVRAGEQYTYGNRMFSVEFDQVQIVINNINEKGFHSNQYIIQVSDREDVMFEHPPCLRHIDIKIIDGAICFYPYFRSWDLWSAFATNLYGLELLKQYIATETGLGNGTILATSKSLHLYSSVWQFAKERVGFEEFSANHCKCETCKRIKGKTVIDNEGRSKE